MPAPPEIHKLVEAFHRDLDSYRSGTYNETQVRVEFIDPLFKALGWDVHNTERYAEAYKDVIHEDQIRVAGASKAPDYCFRIGGARKFFVEAKKPSVNIKQDIHPAYQLRRYAWSAKLPLSILTDFEEFAVYDCRIKPAQTDPASKARTAYYRYTDYIDKWDEIAGIFSRDAILKGSFDRYAESNKRKRGTAEVDTAFLGEIESWRELLARNIALRNKGIAQRDLNHAVQATIDRIIFLRIAEDRGLEEYGQLKGLLTGGDVYEALTNHFRKADDRYNSGLFHFKNEKGREDPDTWTLNLKIDDKILKEVVKGLYYPDSPYEFGVLPADILGQVYERFLGKVIRLKGKSAVVEEKPEVRKAGGVYYTPTYIVEYIVQHTVGKLVEGKTPAQVQGKGKGKAPIRIVDPACGSGSFLLGAYQFLLDWYLDQYKKEPTRHLKGGNPAIFETTAKPAPGETDPGKVYRLTTAERKRILTDHIYGVDIDPQAVEVTKLSLLLKVLEGENIETLNKNMQLFHERALPDLSHNIQCGNSLIASDFYKGKQIEFDEEDVYRINAFDWEKAFPEVFTGGNPGFGAVIGNPPYIRIQTMRKATPEAIPYYKERYDAAIKGNYDIYVLFVECGLELLNTNGRLGFILPHKFFNANFGQGLREKISKGRHLEHVVHFGYQQVFAGVTTYTNLLFLTQKSGESFDFIQVDDLEAWKNSGVATRKDIPSNTLQSSVWNIVAGRGASLYERLSKSPCSLGGIADIFVGLQTSADDVFIMELVETKNKSVCLFSKSLNRTWEFEAEILHPLLSGRDVRRYAIPSARQFILFPYRVDFPRFQLIDFDTLERFYPKSAKYLDLNRGRLESRENGKFSDGMWYRFGRSQNIGIQRQPKICVPRLVDQLRAAIDREGRFCLDNVDVGGVSLRSQFSHVSLELLLALINSALMRWYFPFVSTPFRGGWLSANRQFLSQLPMPFSAIQSDASIAIHDALMDSVCRIHEVRLQRDLANSRHDRNVLQRQIDMIDAEIDRLVYELYGLTDDEIRIVEESAP